MPTSPLQYLEREGSGGALDTAITVTKDLGLATSVVSTLNTMIEEVYDDAGASFREGEATPQISVTDILGGSNLKPAGSSMGLAPPSQFLSFEVDSTPNFEEVQSGSICVETEELEGTTEEVLELVPSQAETSMFEDKSLRPRPSSC